MKTVKIIATIPPVLSHMVSDFASCDIGGDEEIADGFKEAHAAAEAFRGGVLTLSAAAWEVIIDEFRAINDKDGFVGNDAEYRKFRATKVREQWAIDALEKAVSLADVTV